MSDEAPRIDAAEYRIPFVPETAAVDEWLDRVEERVENIGKKLTSSVEGVGFDTDVTAFPAEATGADVVADEPRGGGIGTDRDGELARALEENTNSQDELRDEIEQLTDAIQALTEALNAGGG